MPPPGHNPATSSNPAPEPSPSPAPSPSPEPSPSPAPSPIPTLLLADDLTGALECGALFAARGAHALILTQLPTQSPPQALPRLDALILDTESRHLTPDQAHTTLTAAAAFAATRQPTLVYKKTDSTLRGNIASELHALLDTFPNHPALFAPAYPALGRTVRDGTLYVDGTPLHLTAFAHDPLNPITTSLVQNVLNNLPIEVLDGQTQADIDSAARRVLDSPPPRLAAGPAALAGALAALLFPNPPPPPRLPAIERALIVNGSLHPASRAQIHHALRDGALSGNWRHLDATVYTGADWQSQAAHAVLHALRDFQPDALIVFGGDTAFTIHRALASPPASITTHHTPIHSPAHTPSQAPAHTPSHTPAHSPAHTPAPFHPLGEVLPGIPASLHRGIVWITKAGGFGPHTLLTDLRKLLS